MWHVTYDIITNTHFWAYTWKQKLFSMSQGSTDANKDTDTDKVRDRYTVTDRQIHRHSHRYSNNWFYSFCQKHLTLFSKYQLNVLRFVSLSYYLQLGDRNSVPIPDHCTSTVGVGRMGMVWIFWDNSFIFWSTLCTHSAAKTSSTILGLEKVICFLLPEFWVVLPSS